MRHTVSVPPSVTPEPDDLTPAKPGISVGQVFAFVAGFVALAALGAWIGWVTTTSPAPPADALGTTPSPTATVPSSSPPPPSPSPSVTVTGNVVPDFNALGTTFTDARDTLRAMGLGVALYFNQNGQGATVDHTVPAAGTVVKRGITVKIYVTGPPPLLNIPDITGEGCSTGGKDVAAAGLIPSYPNGRKGVVLYTDPAPSDAQTHWNDQIKVYCGQAGISPSPSDQPSGQPTDGGSPAASATG